MASRGVLHRASREALARTMGQQKQALYVAMEAGRSLRAWERTAGPALCRGFFRAGSTPLLESVGQSNSPSQSESWGDRMDKVKETAKELGEVGKEAVKAVQRDAGKVASAAMEQADTAMDTATQLKDVGVELGKSLRRDAGKVAEAVAGQAAEERHTAEGTAEETKQKIRQTPAELLELGVQTKDAFQKEAENMAEQTGMSSKPSNRD